jgi:hypothetical protein
MFKKGDIVNYGNIISYGDIVSYDKIYTYEDLLNGNGIQNLPAINIITTNPDINRLQSCRDGPIYMGRDGTEFS